MAGDGRARAEWNKALVEDLAASCYARLVMQCVGRMEGKYECLFPIDQQKEQSYSGLWEILTQTVYALLLNQPVLRNVQKQWIAPSSAVLMHEENSENLQNILKNETSLNLVIFENARLRTTLLSRKIVTVTTTPRKIRHFYSTLSALSESPPLSDAATAFSSAKFLLLYCISDLTPSNNYAELDNLPFITLADNKTLGRFCVLPPTSSSHLTQLTSMGFTTLLSLHALRKFNDNLESSIEYLFSDRHEAANTVVHGLDPYFFCEGPASSILRTSPQIYVDSESLQDSPVLLKLYKSPVLQKSMNVTSLTPSMLGDVVNRAIPSDWRGKEEAKWKGGEGAKPSDEWFASLWAYICDNPSSIPNVSEQYCIVPTNEGVVTNLSRGASVISAALLPQNIISSVTALGVRTLLTDLLKDLKAPSDIFSYIFEPTAESLIFAIDAASRRSESR